MPRCAAFASASAFTNSAWNRRDVPYFGKYGAIPARTASTL